MDGDGEPLYPNTLAIPWRVRAIGGGFGISKPVSLEYLVRVYPPFPSGIHPQFMRVGFLAKSCSRFGLNFTFLLFLRIKQGYFGDLDALLDIVDFPFVAPTGLN